MDYLERLVEWHEKDYVVRGEPHAVLARLGARLIREGYEKPLLRPSEGVSIFYQKTTSLMSFLGITDSLVIKAVASREGEDLVRLTVRANEKARTEAERILSEEFEE